LFFLNLMPF